MQAMLTALDTGESFASACNDGFLRDDAMLVVTLLTDEDDDSSFGSADPASWAAKLQQLKPSHDGRDVVVLSYHTTDECAAPPFDAEPDDVGDNLEAFLEQMPNAFVGPICTLDANLLSRAAQTVNDACDALPWLPPAVP